MSSVALAVTRPNANAKFVAMSMLAALADRSPKWTVSGNASIALGTGANDETSARQLIRALDSGVSLGIDAPNWASAHLEARLSMLAVRETEVTSDHVVELLSSLTGDVHCVAIVGQRGCVAYRGPLSSRPLFYTVGADRSLLVVSQIRGILAIRSAEVSIHGLAPFLVPQLCDLSGTSWANIHRLPPGHALTLWNGKLDIKQVARVNAVDSDSANRGELVAEFRNRLLQAIERCSEPPDAILLSGGIDSSSLACAYSSICNGPSRAFALTYDHELAACDERRFVNDVERATGMPVSRLSGNRFLPLVAGFPEGDEPEPWPYAARNWGLLNHVTSHPGQQSCTVIAGEGGDELLLGQVFAVADRYAHGDADGFAQEIRTFPDPEGTGRVVDSLLRGDYDRRGPRVLRALGEVPPWLTGRYVSDAGIVDRLVQGYPYLGKPGTMAINYSRALIAEGGAAGRVQCGGWWEDMGRKVGVKITYPFLDPDLAALTWSLPPELLRDNGVEKVVLREALFDLLPISVAQRRDKAEALALMHAGLGESAGTIRAVARGGPLTDHGVIEPQKLLSSIDNYLAGELDLGPALWATVAVDRWLKEQAGWTTDKTQS